MVIPSEFRNTKPRIGVRELTVKTSPRQPRADLSQTNNDCKSKSKEGDDFKTRVLLTSKNIFSSP